jgi:hypothetical protein
MLKRAYISGGATVEKRVLAGLANVRLQDQPLVDDDRALKFFIQTMLSNNDFRMQHLPRARRRRALISAEKLLVLIIEWIRDEVRGLASHGR